MATVCDGRGTVVRVRRGADGARGGAGRGAGAAVGSQPRSLRGGGEHAGGVGAELRGRRLVARGVGQPGSAAPAGAAALPTRVPIRGGDTFSYPAEVACLCSVRGGWGAGCLSARPGHEGAVRLTRRAPGGGCGGGGDAGRD